MFKFLVCIFVTTVLSLAAFAAKTNVACQNIFKLREQKHLNLSLDRFLIKPANWVDREFREQWAAESTTRSIRQQNVKMVIDLEQSNILEFQKEVNLASHIFYGTYGKMLNIAARVSVQNPYEPNPERDSYNHLRVKKYFFNTTMVKLKFM